MPWKCAGKTITPGKEFRDASGSLHGKLWLRHSAEDKARFGITWEDPPKSEAPFDSRFYSGRKVDGTLIERNLADVNEVDESGNPLKDDDGNQVVTAGLKTIWITKTKDIAKSKLAVHDWYITRKAEKATAIPSSITTYRDAVRTKCAEIETALSGAADLAAFVALFDDTVDTDGKITAVAKINDWPDEI